MKTEEKIRNELELLKRIGKRIWDTGSDNDITEITSRISELEWVLGEQNDDDKMSKTIRKAIVEELCGGT